MKTNEKSKFVSLVDLLYSRKRGKETIAWEFRLKSTELVLACQGSKNINIYIITRSARGRWIPFGLRW